MHLEGLWFCNVIQVLGFVSIPGKIHKNIIYITGKYEFELLFHTQNDM